MRVRTCQLARAGRRKTLPFVSIAVSERRDASERPFGRDEEDGDCRGKRERARSRHVGVSVAKETGEVPSSENKRQMTR